MARARLVYPPILYIICILAAYTEHPPLPLTADKKSHTSQRLKQSNRTPLIAFNMNPLRQIAKPIKEIAKPIKEIAKPIKKITRSLSTKLIASQAARKAARKLKNQFSFVNLNLPWVSEVTIYTESHPSGINANIRPGGMCTKPNLKMINEKLIAPIANRDFYYEHQENYRCSTAVSLEESFERDTKWVCKMGEPEADVDGVDQVNSAFKIRQLIRTSIETQSTTVSLQSRQ